jgi:hypothetical protein
MDADCAASGLRCDLTLPGGSCTKDCASDVDCANDAGVDSVCVSGECYRGCVPDAEEPCRREEYACIGESGHTYCGAAPNDGGSQTTDEGGTTGDGG